MEKPETERESTENDYEAKVFAFRRLLLDILTKECPEITAIQCEGISRSITGSITIASNRDSIIELMDLALKHAPHNRDSEMEAR